MKASAYWQDWKLLNEDGSDGDHTRWKIRPDDKIIFRGLLAGDATGRSLMTADYKSHIYVFCFQSETDPHKWNALDLRQWQFYCLSVEELRSYGRKQISLSKLKAL